MEKGDNGTSILYETFSKAPDHSRVALQIGLGGTNVFDGGESRDVNFEAGRFKSGSKFAVAFGDVPATMDYENGWFDCGGHFD